MTLPAALDTLAEQLWTLREALLSLRVTVVEDRPQRGETVLVEALGDAVEDLTGWLAESAATVDRTRRRVRHGNAAQIVPLLAAVDSHLQQIEAALCQLHSYERLAPLLKMARQQGGEWMSWLHGVGEALKPTQPSAGDVRSALRRCWQAAIEHAIREREGVHNTAIGLQITSKALDFTEGPNTLRDGGH